MGWVCSYVSLGQIGVSIKCVLNMKTSVVLHPSKRVALHYGRLKNYKICSLVTPGLDANVRLLTVVTINFRLGDYEAVFK